MPDDIAVRAFRYLGSYLNPKIIAKNGLNESQIAQALFQIFLEQYDSDCLIKYPYLIVLDQEDLFIGDVQTAKQTSKTPENRQYLGESLPPYRGFLALENKESLEKLKEDLFEIYSDDDVVKEYNHRYFFNFIYNYFEYLTKKEFHSAFDCWDPEYRTEIWQDEIANFIRKHRFITKIGLFDLTNVYVDEFSRVRFYIHYEATLLCYISSDIEKLLLGRVSSLPAAVKNINTLTARLKDHKVDLTELDLQSLLNNDLSEWVHEIFADSQDKLKSIFPVRSTVCFTRFAKVSMKYSELNKKFYIVEFKNLGMHNYLAYNKVNDAKSF